VSIKQVSTKRGRSKGITKRCTTDLVGDAFQERTASQMDPKEDTLGCISDLVNEAHISRIVGHRLFEGSFVAQRFLYVKSNVFLGEFMYREI
jgi:hypothetical protein